MLEKFVLASLLERAPRWIAHGYAMTLVLLSFVIFGNESLPAMGAEFSALFGGARLSSPEALYYLKSYAVTLFAAVVGSTPLPASAARALQKRRPRLAALCEPVLCLGLLALCTAMLVDGSFNPFLYFRF